MNINPNRADDVRYIEAGRMHQLRADRQLYQNQEQNSKISENSEHLETLSKSSLMKRFRHRYHGEMQSSHNMSSNQSPLDGDQIDMSNLLSQPLSSHNATQQVGSPYRQDPGASRNKQVFYSRQGNNLNVSDIKGSSPDQHKRLRKLKGRETNMIDDIPGTRKKQPVVQYREDKQQYLMDADIIGKKKHFVKESNPLDPVYQMPT
jgi:hypothetical protein